MLNGNADARGTEEYNQELSERSAEAVKRYLVDRFHLPAENLITAGCGKKLLKDTAECRSPTWPRPRKPNASRERPDRRGFRASGTTDEGEPAHTDWPRWR
jgi:outer membrane protein OmpA-like peptidoglycan-associated protein